MPAFAIHAGDLVDQAHRDQEWAEWFKAGGFIHRQWTSVPAAGNHEYKPLGEAAANSPSNGAPNSPSQWRKDLPEKLHETVYTVDYQDIRIIVLDSNWKHGEQRDYLERPAQKLYRQMENRHLPPLHLSPLPKARLRVWPRTLGSPCLDKYGVDLVLNGHDHTYARGHVATLMP